MENIRANILETIGHTPLVRLRSLNPGQAEVVAKVEFFNPGGSVKDRVGLALIEDAEKRGALRPGALIVEPTSGNTGIGLAVAAAVKGYRLLLTMPETMSVERRKLLAAYGAEIVLTPGEAGMQGAIDKAVEIVSATPGAFMPQQFANPANPAAHARTTAEEIWADCGGRVDAFVAGVGTGGTFSGVGEVLKRRNPEVWLVAVEPDGSAILSGQPAGPHQLQGIGPNFIPQVMRVDLVDESFPVSAADAGAAARAAARQEGMLIGISGGAALHAALELSRRPEFAGKRVVVLLPDTGERYLSSWLFA
ncbi:MAG: cysteine synthase A [Planctomycetes bacterium]|nr:cysteine synthase A [Planctomycetota bacterium]